MGNSGWYQTRGEQGWRYWDGERWTWRTTLDDPATRDAQDRAAVRTFLHNAFRGGQISADDLVRLLRWVGGPVEETDRAPLPIERREAGPAMPAPPPLAHQTPAPAHSAPAAVPAPVAPLRHPAPPVVATLPPPVLARTPAAWTPDATLTADAVPPAPHLPSWRERARAALAADLSVYGLAYLGVLLLFAGVAGFVVFATGSLERGWRPVAELLVPTTLFLGGWVLSRRGAHVVGRSLTFAGGATLPVVAIATFVDGASIPPELHGNALVVAATAVPLAIAAAYAWIGTRHPTSPLRYLAAPTLWLSVAMAALAPRAGELNGWVGNRIATPAGCGQVAAVLVAIAAVALAARRWPAHPLSRPSLLSATAGLGVMLVLGAMVGARDGWPLGPALVAAVAVAVALEGLAPLLPSWLVSIGQAAALAAPLLVPLGRPQLGWLATFVTVAELALLEWQSKVRAEDIAVRAAAAGALVALATALVDPWAALVALSVAAVWTGARFVRPLPTVPQEAAELALALLPFAWFGDLARIVDPVTVTLLAAGGLVAFAVALRVVPAGRTSRWQWWTVAAASTAALAALALTSSTAPSLWLAAAVATSGVALALTTTPAAPRTWLSAAALYGAGGIVLGTVGAGTGAVALTLATAGLVLAPAAWRHEPAALHLSAIGLLTGATGVAVALTASPLALDVVLALAVATWCSNAVAAELGRWTFDRPDLTEAIGWTDFVPLVPDTVALMGLPALALVVLQGAGLLATSATPAGLALAAFGLAYGLATRPLHGRRLLATLLSTGGFVLAVAATPLAWSPPAALLAVSLALVVWPFVTHRDLRLPVAPWFAWAATGGAAVAVAQLAGVPVDRLGPVALAWAGTLALGALTGDRFLAGPRPGPGWIRTATLEPPALLGSLGAAAALAVVVAVDPVWAWCCLAAAAGLTVAALLTRTGGVTIAAWVLGLAGVGGLVPSTVIEAPWVWVAAGAGVLLVSALLERSHRADQPWWAAYDLPAFVVAHALVLVGVVTVSGNEQIVVTWAPAGVLALVVAWWRRNVVWLAAGTVLLVGAATAAGPAWRTAALIVLSAAFFLLASRVDEPVRVLVRGAGAAAAGVAWWSLIDWLAWPTTTWVSTTALASGALALALAGGLRWTGLRPLSAAPGAALAGIGVGAAIVGLTPDDRLVAGLAVAGGTALLAAAVGLVARPLHQDALRYLAAGGGVGAFSIAAWAVEPTQLQIVLVTLALSLGGAIALLALTRWSAASPWRAPAELTTLAFTAWSVGAAIGALPERGLLVGALAAAGGVFAVLSIPPRRQAYAIAVPGLEVAAWLVWATAALAGEPAWLLMPVGLGLLVEASLLRQLSADRQAFEVAELLELSGMALLVVPSLVETATRSLVWALPAAALGLALVAWGLVTKVRLRLAVGVAAEVLAVALLLLVPLASLLPAASAGTLFLSVAGVGLLAILVATFLESGRVRLHHTIDHLRDLTRGWS